MTDDERLSKLLSFWLRHRPDAAGIGLDNAGWARVEEVVEALGRECPGTGRSRLEEVVRSSEKQRFELSEDGQYIRARQGHSVAVDADWPLTAPPCLLFHGTAERLVPAILSNGLKAMKRHHVHLSGDAETARLIGLRRGPPAVLKVEAGRMARDGYLFRLSSNGVWLVDHVPPDYLARG